jgi:hypothetical protein
MVRLSFHQRRQHRSQAAAAIALERTGSTEALNWVLRTRSSGSATRYFFQIRYARDDRLATRAATSTPLLAELQSWPANTRARIRGKSDLAGAIRYTLSR